MSGDFVKLGVDGDRCIGVGQCEMLEPEVFLVDEDDGIGRVTGDGLIGRQRAEILIDRCPSGAISIVSEDG